MSFFNSAVDVLQTLVIALGAGLAIWGALNLLEGYGNDNPAAKGQGIYYTFPKEISEESETEAEGENKAKPARNRQSGHENKGHEAKNFMSLLFYR